MEVSQPFSVQAFLLSNEDRLQRLALSGPYVPGTIPERQTVYPPHSSTDGSSRTSRSSAFSRATPGIGGRNMSEWSRCAPSTVTSATSSPPSIAPVNEDNHAPEPQLPCEFVGLANCNRKFSPNDTQAWIGHCIDHLKKKYPAKALCWFCDRQFPIISSFEDPKNGYRRRMWHIRGHIINEGKGEDHMRPDYQLLKHLNENGIISDRTYSEVITLWREVIPYPNDDVRPVPRPSDLVDHDFVPLPRRREQEREMQVPVDLEKEGRKLRREQRQRSRT